MIETEERMLNVKEVAKMFGCSDRHIERLVTAGEFPPPRKIGHLSRWPLAKLREFIRQEPGISS